MARLGAKKLPYRGLIVEASRGSDTLDSFEVFPASHKTSPHHLFGTRLSVYRRVKARQDSKAKEET